jgi:hypothetical protein
MRHFCRTGPSPRTWRQFAIGWGREYIPPRYHNNAPDTAVAHSTNQGRSGYGVARGDLPMMTPDAIWEQRDAGSDWWDNVGVGLATAEPRPIRFVRLGVPAALSRISAPAVSPQSLKAILDAAFSEFQANFLSELPSLIRSVNSQQLLLAKEEMTTSPQIPARSSTKGGASLPIPPSSPISAWSSEPLPSVPDIAYQFDPIHPLSDFSSDDPHACLELYENCTVPVPVTRHLTDSNTMGNVLIPSTSDIDMSSPSTYTDYYTVDMSLLTDEAVWALDDEGLTVMARQGIRRALGDEDATEKSPEQLEAIKEALRANKDFSFILPTGGGKSLVWQVVAIQRPKWGSIIVAPYVLVLEEQLKSSLAKGIVAAKYTAKSVPPKGFQNLFIQPETGGSKAFAW